MMLNIYYRNCSLRYFQIEKIEEDINSFECMKFVYF